MWKGIVQLKETLKLRTRFQHWRESPHPRHFPIREMILLRVARRVWQNQYSSEPLISVTIPTWNRGKLLVERTLPSVLNQTYQNFEIVIVGDGCTDDTEERIRIIGDPRIRFFNMPRATYPADPVDRWRVAGTYAVNKAIDLARGTWFSYLDDDDIYLPDRLEVMLNYVIAHHSIEFIYGVCEQEIQPGVWHSVGSWPPHKGDGAHSAVLYSSILRFFKYDPFAWKRNQPGDADLWDRMFRSGVKMSFVNRVVCRAPLRPNETLLQSIAIQPDHVKEYYFVNWLSQRNLRYKSADDSDEH